MEMQVVKRYKLQCLFLLCLFCLLASMIIVSLAGGSQSSRPHRVVVATEPNAPQRTYSLLSYIPQHGSELGDPDAPVTLQFFGDLQCRESRQVMLGPIPDLIRRYVRPGELRIVYHSTETDTRGAGGWPEFKYQQSGALAAGMQGKLWNFIDVFYREQGPEYTGYVSEKFLHLIAAQAGVELARWKVDQEAPYVWHWESRLQSDKALGERSGVDSTPSFLIGPTGGKARVLRHFGLEEPAVFDEAVEKVLKST
jgi:hypothetical protein